MKISCSFAVYIANLYKSPAQAFLICACQTPVVKHGSIMFAFTSQLLKEPTTLTLSAFGAHTAKRYAAPPSSMVTRWQPSALYA